MRQRMAAICKSSHFFHTEGKRRGVKTTGPRRGGVEPCRNIRFYFFLSNR